MKLSAADHPAPLDGKRNHHECFMVLMLIAHSFLRSLVKRLE